ncbi:MAG: transcriptional regulator [Acidobacteria bacterium]|nr:transcriptional regulator [Acidobacteriota bacterium]
MATHPVFTIEEFAEWHASNRTTGGRAVEALLAYHVNSGHLVRVRKGLYATVPGGSTAAIVPIDPFLVAGRLTPDAILAYHTALEFHGKAHSPTHEFFYLTSLAARPLEFRGQRFRAVHPPAALRSKRAEHSNALTADRMGLSVRVTNLERTMVDVLDRPHLGGGWEEIWRSLEGVEFFDLDAVVEYALLLENATTIAKVGFFLEQHREPLMVEDRHVGPLRQRIPRVPHYFSRADRRSGKLVPGWNLVVPPEIVERRWQAAV